MRAPRASAQRGQGQWPERVTHTHARRAHRTRSKIYSFRPEAHSTLQTHIKQLVRGSRAAAPAAFGPRRPGGPHGPDGAHTYTYTARAAAHPSAARPARCAQPGRARAARLRPRANATPAARRRGAPALSAAHALRTPRAGVGANRGGEREQRGTGLNRWHYTTLRHGRREQMALYTTRGSRWRRATRWRCTCRLRSKPSSPARAARAEASAHV